jgi:hypothetical protein
VHGSSDIALTASMIERDFWISLGGIRDQYVGEDTEFLRRAMTAASGTDRADAVVTWHPPATVRDIWRKYVRYSVELASAGDLDWQLAIIGMYGLAAAALTTSMHTRKWRAMTGLLIASGFASRVLKNAQKRTRNDRPIAWRPLPRAAVLTLMIDAGAVYGLFRQRIGTGRLLAKNGALPEGAAYDGTRPSLIGLRQL